jgi:hypothetical protein
MFGIRITTCCIQIFLVRSRSLKSDGSSGAIFQPQSKIGIRIIANQSDLRALIIHLWMRYYQDHIFETADFQM